MAGGSKRRRLSDEDRAIWERVARTATPLRAPAKAGAGPRAEPTEIREPRGPLRTFRPEGPARPAVQAQLLDHRPHPVGRPEPGLDRRTAERLRRGEREPEARIDLHGLTAARAHARLDAFLRRAIAARHRCVLVITGKGGRGPGGEDAPFMRPASGVLRDAAPRWLRSGPHAGRILGLYEAHQRHGGAGAFYVYLKKSG